LRSRDAGRELHEIVVVPAGARVRQRSLLVLLHGRHDAGPADWVTGRHTGPETMLSNYLFDGLARLPAQRRPIVLLADGGTHSYYHDRRGGRWATEILREAIPDAERRFGIIAGDVAIGGISMGGYGALHLASLRPHEFCAVGGHSAALWTSAGATAPGAFDDASDYARNDIFAAVRAGRFPHVPVWIDSGSADPFHDADAALVRLLEGNGVAVTYHVWPGGHTGSYWHAHMAAYLAFYAAALAHCR
jgi:S-formylglutathione hydrolase FrmB